MQAIPNVETKDSYDPALTLENQQATTLTITAIANASVLAKFRAAKREGGGEQSYDAAEVLLTPQAQIISNVSGVKFRSAVPGTPARVAALLLGPDDPQIGAGIPFTGTLAASGAVAAGGAGTFPAGVIVPFAGAAPPAGWVLCDGSTYDASAPGSDKLALWQAIGTLYGGTGQNNFAVPDLRGRVVAGLGTNAAVDTLGKNDGVAVANRRPQHRHTPHAHAINNSATGSTTPSLSANRDTNMSASTGAADGGSGNANDSLDAPAYLVLDYIIAL